MRTRRLSLLLFCLLALVPAVRPADAQTTASVSGTVTDTLTGAPVAEAVVVVESPIFSRQAKTDAEGLYRLSDIPVGAFHLIVRKNQFLQYRAELTVGSGNQTHDVRLDPELHFSEVT